MMLGIYYVQNGWKCGMNQGIYSLKGVHSLLELANEVAISYGSQQNILT
jgi:hypothetical protein